MKKRKGKTGEKMKAVWYGAQIRWNRKVGNWMLRGLHLPPTSPALLRRGQRLTKYWLLLCTMEQNHGEPAPQPICVTCGASEQKSAPAQRMCGSGK